MTVFEPWTSEIGSDLSTNWATTTAQDGDNLKGVYFGASINSFQSTNRRGALLKNEVKKKC